MENPLSDFIEVDIREDGLYLKVIRSSKENVTIEKIENRLKEALVTNYDIARIRDIFTRSRGVFEKAGLPFEYYDIKFDSFIDVNISPMEATMRVDSEAITEGIQSTESTVLYCLQRHGIRFGIKNDKVKEFVENGLYDVEVVIAEGIPPEPGIDGKIEMEVEIDPDSSPKIEKSGKVNYRDIKTFATVNKGQVLARRIPPKIGKAGCTITGEKIESHMGKDVKLPKGKNTEISKDGTLLCALKTGVVFEYGRCIHVGELLDIKKDVDFSVGNIKYTGDIVIRGNVMPGFIIEAEGDIDINGEVESATIISRHGFVNISRGVLGKGETRIIGEKGVSINFAQEVKIKTEGTLTVEKHLLHCNCICSVLEGSTGASSIIGGEVKVYDHVEVMNIGNDKNIPTNIFLVDKEKEKFKEKLKELNSFKEKIMNSLKPVQLELRTKYMIMKKVGNEATERQKQELKKWVDTYNNLNMKIKYVDKKASEIKEEINNPSYYNGFIKANGTVFEGVTLNMYGVSKKKIDTKMTTKTFRLKGNIIESEE